MPEEEMRDDRKIYVHCLDCHRRQAVIFKIGYRQDERVCSNPDCWRFTDVIKLTTWTKH